MPQALPLADASFLAGFVLTTDADFAVNPDPIAAYQKAVSHEDVHRLLLVPKLILDACLREVVSCMCQQVAATIHHQ